MIRDEIYKTVTFRFIAQICHLLRAYGKFNTFLCCKLSP